MSGWPPSLSVRLVQSGVMVAATLTLFARAVNFIRMKFTCSLMSSFWDTRLLLSAVVIGASWAV